MEINGAFYFALYNKRALLYFGCSNFECEMYFILKE
jgi:hypothetical protein